MRIFGRNIKGLTRQGLALLLAVLLTLSPTLSPQTWDASQSAFVCHTPSDQDGQGNTDQAGLDGSHCFKQCCPAVQSLLPVLPILAAPHGTAIRLPLPTAGYHRLAALTPPNARAPPAFLA